MGFRNPTSLNRVSGWVSCDGYHIPLDYIVHDYSLYLMIIVIQKKLITIVMSICHMEITAGLVSASDRRALFKLELCYNSIVYTGMADNVLVLNANYEPIHVCNTRRALGLILTEKAILVANGRGNYHTIRQSIPCPSVIRLQQMVRRPRIRLKLTRREIFRRDGFQCQYCGRHVQELTVDHVVPRHLGGQHTWANVVAACPTCNHRKGGRLLQDANMHLHHLPAEPPASARYVFGRHLPDALEWTPFLEGW